MTKLESNLRKAAVLLRSLDSDTAAIMLAQLSPDEAASIRGAIRALGTVDLEEQDDVLADFRRTRPAVGAHAVSGVELELSSPFNGSDVATATAASSSADRFQFLASASTSALVRFLAREHAQTIAVVLAHLTPARAASVLAELPEKLQSETIDRLSVLGDTDPESVSVLERELAAWLATRGDDRGAIARRRETVTNILAAADEKTRRGILGKLKMHNSTLAEQIAPEQTPRLIADKASPTVSDLRRRLSPVSSKTSIEPPAVIPVPRTPTPRALPRIAFDQLFHLDDQALTAILNDVDAKILAIALAGSREVMVDRVCGLMPKGSARAFRRELRFHGPTRLSDVETAQRAVADTAARYLAQRRPSLITARN